MKQRYEFIDYARGIAILLVVLGHCCSTVDGCVNRTILSFHMPLFFFLSGIFAKEYTCQTAWGGIINKILRILIPQILLVFTIMILRVVPLLFRGSSLADFDWLYGLRYWFLPTLFFCSLLYILLSLIVDMSSPIVKIIVVVVDVAAIFLTLFVFDIPNGALVKYVKLVPVSFLFYVSGRFLKKWVLSLPKPSIGRDTILVIFAILLFVVSQVNGHVSMYLSNYGCFPLFLLSASLGIIVVVEGCKYLQNMEILREFGEMSIAVYVWNFVVVGFTEKITFRIIPEIAGGNGVRVAVSFVIAVLVLYIISKITLKYLPIIYGQNKKRS